jgi:excisionase family DNA binding protein
LKALKVSEVAQELQVDRDTVYRLIKSGKLSAFRVGTRSWRIERRDLDDFIARGKREAYRPATPCAGRARGQNALKRGGRGDWSDPEYCKRKMNEAIGGARAAKARRGINPTGTGLKRLNKRQRRASYELESSLQAFYTLHLARDGR